HYYMSCFIFQAYADPRALHSFPTRRSSDLLERSRHMTSHGRQERHVLAAQRLDLMTLTQREHGDRAAFGYARNEIVDARDSPERDRKSTRLNSSHRTISYAVFCLKKKKKKK